MVPARLGTKKRAGKIIPPAPARTTILGRPAFSLSIASVSQTPNCPPGKRGAITSALTFSRNPQIAALDRPLAEAHSLSSRKTMKKIIIITTTVRQGKTACTCGHLCYVNFSTIHLDKCIFHNSNSKHENRNQLYAPEAVHGGRASQSNSKKFHVRLYQHTAEAARKNELTPNFCIACTPNQVPCAHCCIHSRPASNLGNKPALGQQTRTPEERERTLTLLFDVNVYNPDGK